eukprot:161243_1
MSILRDQIFTESTTSHNNHILSQVILFIYSIMVISQRHFDPFYNISPKTKYHYQSTIPIDTRMQTIFKPFIQSYLTHLCHYYIIDCSKRYIKIKAVYHWLFSVLCLLTLGMLWFNIHILQFKIFTFW